MKKLSLVFSEVDQNEMSVFLENKQMYVSAVWKLCLCVN